MLSVLIVEDEEIVAADLANKVRQLGYQVTATTPTGEEAIKLARDSCPDVVLMDIRLAGQMDGVEAAEHIRIECRIPIIYLTAHSDRATLQRAKVTEPFGYILKPFEERELETHIEMAVYKHTAERQLRESQEQLRQFNAELEQRVTERTAELRGLAAELTQSEERERRRIAQILHDDLQQLLASARMYLGIAIKELEPTKRAQHLARTNQLLIDSIRISRELSHELSPPILDQSGFGDALNWLARWMEEKHGLRVEVEAHDEGVPLPEDIALLLFHSVRELLFNVVKHSGVDYAKVLLQPERDGQIEIQVSDQGKGFDPGRINGSHGPTGGFGLFGIRERLQWLGGRLAIDSSDEHGTRVCLIAPARTGPWRH